MAQIDRIGLKDKFSPRGKKPRVEDFADFIDSVVNKIDDAAVIGLQEYVELHSYLPGNTCIYDGYIYIALDSTSGEFDPEKWFKIEGTNMWEIDGEGTIKPKDGNKIDAAHIANLTSIDKLGIVADSVFSVVLKKTNSLMNIEKMKALVIVFMQNVIA